MNKCPICGEEICSCVTPIPDIDLAAKNAAEVAKRNAAILEAFMNGKTVEEF